MGNKSDMLEPRLTQEKLRKTTALLRRWINIESAPIKRLETIYDQLVKDTNALLDALAKRGY